MAPTRRALLAALAAGLAGCTADGDGPSTRTPTPPERSPSTPGVSPTTTETVTPVAEPRRVGLDDERLRWRVDLPRERVTAPAVADGRLYVGVGDEQSLDFTDDPDVAGDLVAIATDAGAVYGVAI